MRQINMSYARAEACFYEAMRIIKGASEWTAEKEGNALINPERTPDNFELIPHHPALNPSVEGKSHRGQEIANYHKAVTGRSARLNGPENQLSKAIGCIATLPKDYLDIDYGLTEKEYLAVTHHIESEETNEPNLLHYHSAIEKVRNYKYTVEEKEKIKEFFEAFLKAWKKVAGIRDEDMLYAVVHLDETFPHIHVMGLPTIQNPETGKITFSTSKYNNRVTHYYDTLHTRVIQEMAVLGIDGSGLLNGATKERSFNPADFNQEERKKGTRINTENIILQKRNEMLKEAKEYAEADFLWAESQMDDTKKELSEMEAKKQETSENVGLLSSVVKSARQEVDFLRAEREEIASELELQRNDAYVKSLSEKEFMKWKKELEKSLKSGKTIKVQPEEIARLIHSSISSKNLQRREEALLEKERNIDTIIEEGIKRRFPEELQKAMEAKAYWEEYSLAWEQYAEQVTMQAKENEKREEQVSRKEHEMDVFIGNQVQALYQQKKRTLLKTVIDLVHSLVKAIITLLPSFIQEFIKEKIEQKEKDFMNDLECIFDEKNIELHDQGE